MYKITCALAAYLACGAHGSQWKQSARRLQDSQDELNKRSASSAGSNRQRRVQSTFTPMSTLAMLLAAFKSSSSGLHSGAAKVPCVSPRPVVKDRSSHVAHRIHMMSVCAEPARHVHPFLQFIARSLATMSVFLMLMTGSPQALTARESTSDIVAAARQVLTTEDEILNDHLSYVTSDIPAVSGSPIVREVVALLDRYYIYQNKIHPELEKVSKQIEEKGPLTEQEALRVSAALVRQLPDPYSRVLTPEKAKAMDQFDITGGVGINMRVAKNGDVVVGSVPPADSEASRMGVEMYDQVLTVNDKSTRGMTSFDLLDAIQASGKTVPLKIRSARDGVQRTVALSKRAPVSNPVKFKLFENGPDKIGYMKLSVFDSQGEARLREAVYKLEAAGATRLVLDLRGNTGGVLNGALGIAGFFMERPLVLLATDAKGTMQPVYSQSLALEKNKPLQVWVDESTASSAEVLAGALRDNCRATLVGKTTYGKGLIQGVYDLSDGASLVETIASYSTPSGAQIDGLGIRPDVDRVFFSDIFGQRLIDEDLKAAGKIFKRQEDQVRACRESQALHLLWPDYKPQWPGTMGSPVATQQTDKEDPLLKWKGFEGIMEEK